MKKQLLILFLLLSLVGLITLVVQANNLDSYSIASVFNLPSEYKLQDDLQKKKQLKIRSQKKWVLAFDSVKSIEAKVSGKKKDPSGMEYSTSSLFVNIKGKKMLIDSGCYSYGRVSWNIKGDQIIYLRIEAPPADVPIGDVYLVSIDDSNNKVCKKMIIDRIGASDFRWAQKSNFVAFSDFQAVYILNSDNGDLKVINGEWAKEIKAYKKGIGYPRRCNSFVWLNNDQDLYFAYAPNLNIRDDQKYYVIKFK